MNTTEQPFRNERDSKLRKAADKLRSNPNAANYKHVVPGPIILKYASDAFEERQTQLLELFQCASSFPRATGWKPRSNATPEA